MSVNAPNRPGYRQPDPKYMTFIEHLGELRRRLTFAVVAIVLGTIIGWFLAPHVIHAIDQPLCRAFNYRNCRIVVTSPAGAFTLQLKVAFLIGFAFAMPVTVYQLWAFVAPAFGPAANRWAPAWVTSAIALFAGGALTGYLIIPLALSFLAKFQGTDVQIIPFANDYIGFISLILVVFGLSYEMPLVLVSLAAVGITSSRWLASKRIPAFFIIFAFATVVTPGADLVSPLILGAILYVLFEVSILVSRLLGK